jgi:1,2-phenylacetyl-CoA epoxidase catalytic subunit
MSRESTEPHDLAPEAFLDEVHSFEFWFQAVEGYLSACPFGRDPELADAPLGDSDRDALVTTLCNYAIGETAALDASSGLIRIAPNRRAKVFLATQVVDEARHLEVLLHRLRELGVTDLEAEVERRANHSLLTFRDRLLQFVDGRDWEAAVFAQNVILESMEFAVFQAHAERADPVTQQVLTGIIKDERRHMGFGENELGRRLGQTPHIRPRLQAVKKDLDALVLDTFEDTLEQIGVARSQRPELGRRYLASVERLGFGL